MSLNTLYALADPYLSEVEEVLSSKLNRADRMAYSELSFYVLQASGKKLRPLLFILSFLLLCPSPTEAQKKQLLSIASSIELIHLASLVHDDVIDDADTRRGQASVKGKWGNPLAVSFGVYLYAVAIQELSLVGRVDVISVLSETVQKMCEGELYQLGEKKTPSLSSEKYFLMIQYKTAELFKASALLSGLLASATSSEVQALSEYGFYLGMLFQLSDDVLDLLSDGSELKKEKAQDFYQGQFTLPLLLLLEKLPDSEREYFLTSQRTEALLSFVLEKCVEYDILTQLLSFCKQYDEKARKALLAFPESHYRSALLELLELVVSRLSLKV